MSWPVQTQCNAFYGDPCLPNGAVNFHWVEEHLVYVKVPWVMYMGHITVKVIHINRKCSDSLTRVISALWAKSKHNQRTIDAWGLSSFSGSFAFRTMRGINMLSMHAYGCAVDFDGEHNPLGGPGMYHEGHPVVVAFQNENWEWGGGWKTRPDPMHFQAAVT